MTVYTVETTNYYRASRKTIKVSERTAETFYTDYVEDFETAKQQFLSEIKYSGFDSYPDKMHPRSIRLIEIENYNEDDPSEEIWNEIAAAYNFDPANINGEESQDERVQAQLEIFHKVMHKEYSLADDSEWLKEFAKLSDIDIEEYQERTH